MEKALQDFHSSLMSKFLSGSGIRDTKELTQLSQQSRFLPGVHFSSFKDLYDVAEFSLNQVLGVLPESQAMSLCFLKEFSSLLPSETERSVHQSIYQQFSTPLPMAFTMASLLRITPSTVAVEPSAGTGNLAECVRLRGTKHLLVNELHDFRHHLLCHGDYEQCTREDGLQLNNLTCFDGRTIDCVIINPPFSRQVNTGSRVDILAGANHLLAAYKRLREGGRMVLIINATFGGSHRGWKHFVKHLGTHKVLVNCLLDSSAFLRKGTAVPTRLILLHKGNTRDDTFPQAKASLSEIIHFSNLLNQHS